MPDSGRRLILGNGEKLVGVVEKKSTFVPPAFPRPYEEARDRLVRHVSTALEKAKSIPPAKRHPDELVFCLRLHPDMLAKSYDPDAIFRQVPDLRNVGSRQWSAKLADVAPTSRVQKQIAGGTTSTIGRLLFVQSGEQGFQRLLRTLETSQSRLRKDFIQDVQKIESFDFLSAGEQLLGFEDWKGGRVELVFHPSQVGPERQLHFIETLFRQVGIPNSKASKAVYEDGPTFVSVPLSRDTLSALRDCNPLRMAHPLPFPELEDLRSLQTLPAPPPPTDQTVSTIKVGVFDGGIDTSVPLLQRYAEEDSALAIKTKANPRYVSHGTAVAGAVLFGSLHEHDHAKPLPAPPVSVVGIRVLPTSDPKDFDLYEAIDVIEAAVPARPDIKIFNLSLGPKGPILDDDISRFSYVIDRLTLAHKVMFCVAVGNDGEIKENRIQAPADAVHALGVGAFSERGGKRLRAPYSCVGPGREGAKMKPDLVAFGGCAQTPFHLVAASPGKKVLKCGTSFASPLVASLCAQASGRYDRATALLTRCLVTHAATHPDGSPDHEFGHGCAPKQVDEILSYPQNAVTVAYQGELSPRSFYKLPIPIPENLALNGNVSITWTIAVLCPVAFNHPGDYTTCCVEDTFYPNDQVFAYSRELPKKQTKRLHIKNQAADITALGTGWKRSTFPCSASGNQYPTEHERRTMDYKWDTIVSRKTSHRGTSLYRPFLVLHAINRHSPEARFDYAAVVTISAPKFQGDLFAEVVKRYPVLQPIRLRTEAEIRVTV